MCNLCIPLWSILSSIEITSRSFAILPGRSFGLGRLLSRSMEAAVGVSKRNTCPVTPEIIQNGSHFQEWMEDIDLPFSSVGKRRSLIWRNFLYLAAFPEDLCCHSLPFYSPEMEVFGKAGERAKPPNPFLFPTLLCASVHQSCLLFSSILKITILAGVIRPPFLFNNPCNGSKGKKVSLKSVQWVGFLSIVVELIGTSTANVKKRLKTLRIIKDPNEYTVARASWERWAKFARSRFWR